MRRLKKTSRIQLGHEIGSKEIIKDSALSLSDSNKAISNFENALKYHEKYHENEKKKCWAKNRSKAAYQPELYAQP